MSEPDDEVLGKAYDARLMKRLLRYARPYRLLVAVAILALISFSALDLARPEIIKRAMDGPVAGALRGEIGDAEAITWLLHLALLFAGLIVAVFLVRAVQMWLVEYIGQRVMVDLRRELFTKIQRLSLRFFDRTPVGTLVTRVVSDVEALYQVLSTGLVAVFGDVVKIVGIVVILVWLDAGLALWLLSVLPLLFLVGLRFRIRARQAYRDVRKEIARTNANLQESITGVRVTQAFGQEERAKESFGERTQALFEAHRRTVREFAAFFPKAEFLFAVAQGILVWVGAEYVVGSGLTVGKFMQTWMYITFIFEPVRNLTEQYNVMQAAMASSERIFRILDTPEDVPNPPSPLRRREIRGEIEFENVWFAYRDEDWVLRDLSFRVAPGESIALVGATGAGKTSIISLVSRLYDVKRGRILLDGTDLRDYDKYEMRSRISVVLQDVFLFAGDILTNIRLGKREIPEERVVEAARAVNASAFIERLPGGYRAPVLERGATLSVGQKQLLAFARALAFDPRILILDEATSSVDTETEVLIQRALDTLLAGRTSIVIAHRLSTIQRCDRILVMHHGELREMGTHAELIAKRGIYRKLYELQYGLAAG